jgi:hypothetical protein
LLSPPPRGLVVVVVVVVAVAAPQPWSLAVPCADKNDGSKSPSSNCCTP